MEYRPSPKQKPIKVPQGMLNAPITIVVAFNSLYLVRRFIFTFPYIIFHYPQYPLAIYIIPVHLWLFVDWDGRVYTAGTVQFDLTTNFANKRLNITIPPVPTGKRLGTLPIPGRKIFSIDDTQGLFSLAITIIWHFRTSSANLSQYSFFSGTVIAFILCENRDAFSQRPLIP